MSETKPKRMAIIASQGTLDTAYPPVILASTAAAMDMEVAIFFTFYGFDLIHKKRSKKLKVSPIANPAAPMPVLKSKKALKELEINQVLEILATDPGSMADIPAWARTTGQELISSEELGPKSFRFLVKRLK